MATHEDLSFFASSDASTTDHPSARAAQSTLAQYLMFVVSKVQMAVALAHVSEIAPYERVSPVPGTPAYVRGVVHVRGRVIPVVDFAIKLSREPEAVTKRTCILMLELALAGRQLPVGIVMDDVATLLDVDVAQIMPAPRFGASVEVEYLEGLLPTEDCMLPLIDFQRVFASDELMQVASTAAAASGIKP